MLSAELRAALCQFPGQGFGLRAQPIVPVDGSAPSYEVLLSVEGYAPMAVVHQAKAANETVALDEQVLRTLVEHTAALPSKLSVNLHGVSLLSPRCFALLGALMGRCEAVQVELLEYDELVGNAVLQARLGALSSQGVRIAIDDFGAGDSLGNLASLAGLVDTVKLDKAFLALGRLGRTLPFFRSSVQSLKNAGYCVVVEGVETVTDYALARDAGATAMQGYFLGHPAPFELKP